MIKYLAKNQFVLFLLIGFLSTAITMLLNIDNLLIRAIIIGSAFAILTPRRRKLDTQTGKKTQITWFLLKEPVFIDE